MIYPILAYGDKILRKKSEVIEKNDPELAAIIENMWETMYNAYGIGLAAPQVGKTMRLFVVDTTQLNERDDLEEEADEVVENAIKQAFINPEIITSTKEKHSYNEGCLSIPDIREDVTRPDAIRIKYMDENFVEHEEDYVGLNARVIQHEYDHIEGILFTDHLSSLKKRLLKRRLEAISKGNIDVDYKMKFPIKR